MAQVKMHREEQRIMTEKMDEDPNLGFSFMQNKVQKRQRSVRRGSVVDTWTPRTSGVNIKLPLNVRNRHIISICNILEMNIHLELLPSGLRKTILS